jgi:membrane protease YdiL (CAAX protease family)
MRSLTAALRRVARRRPVLAFLAVAFASSWAYGLVFLRLVDPVVDYPLSQLLSLPFAWGPLVGAAAVASVTTDASAGAWLRDAVDVSVPLRWLALAFLLPVVVQDAPDLLLAAAGEPVVVGASGLPQYVLVFGFTLCLGGALEEFGWRAFVQARLQARWGALAAAAAVGVAWALWHLPLHAAGYTFADDSFLLFTGYLVGLSVVLAWLYNSTAGVLPAMVLHAAHNMPGVLAPAEGAEPLPVLDSSIPLLAGVWLALGAVLAAVYGPNALSGRGPPAADSSTGADG